MLRKMAKIKSEYIRTLTKSNVTMEDTVAVVDNKFVDVWTYQVPAAQYIFFGNGRINLGVDDRGTYQANYNTSVPADIPGISRLILRDANGINSTFIREDLSVDYETGVKVGKGGKTGNEANKPFVKQYEYLVGQFQADAAATISKADSTLYVPVTVQAL